jgi:hypothetical protein
MPMRATILVAAVAAAVDLAGPGTASAAAGWQVSYMPIPGGYEGGYFSVLTTDGKGDYAGTAYLINGTAETDLVVWEGARTTVVRNPGFCTDVYPKDQNPSGLIAVTAYGCADVDGYRAYTYDGGGFHQLPAPEGYQATTAIAVNLSGDVLGRAWNSTSGAPDITVLWRHGVPTPVVIADTMTSQTPVDLDDDGAVLFDSEEGAAILRGTTLVRLTKPAGFDHIYPSAIRNGVVVGTAVVAEPQRSAAYWWPTPTTPKALTGATTATDINASGLVVGDLMTWRNGVSAGLLPNPNEGLASASFVGDDGTVVGSVDPDYRTTIPVKWVNASGR